jgi:hypothetical protein
MDKDMDMDRSTDRNMDRDTDGNLEMDMDMINEAMTILKLSHNNFFCRNWHAAEIFSAQDTAQINNIFCQNF